MCTDKRYLAFCHLSQPFSCAIFSHSEKPFFEAINFSSSSLQNSSVVGISPMEVRALNAMQYNQILDHFNTNILGFLRREEFLRVTITPDISAPQKMSPSIDKYYRLWLRSPKLMADLADREKCYQFVRQCVKYRTGDISGSWLKKHLEADLAGKFSDDLVAETITKAVAAFTTIVEYENLQFPI